jgi:anaerobic magnesium-protoporphyrin IX monomethyl ester cyclase
MKISLVMCPIWSIDEPPMATAYLSGQLKSKGYNVFCHDLGLELYNGLDDEDKKKLAQMYLGEDWYNNFNYWKCRFSLDSWVDKWAREILSREPHIVGFTIYDATCQISLLLAAAIKAYSSATIIVFGGPSCTDDDQLILRVPIDFIVYGEGEDTITDLVERIQNGKNWDDCPGIVYRRNGDIVRTKPRGLISNINTIPFPDFEDFELGSYKTRVLPMLTSRGCPNKCSFCSESPRWIRYRFRVAENIVMEMERNAVGYDIRHFDMVDSLINGNLTEFERMCDLLIEKNLDVTWAGKARVHSRMDITFLKKAYAAGCRMMLFGIESASQRVLDHMGKNVKVEDIGNVILNCYEAGIKVGAFFVIGYVSEMDEDFQMTIDFVKRYHKYIDTIFPGSSLYILKGSPLHEDPEKYGLILSEDSPDGRWRSVDGRNTEGVRMERLTIFNRLIVGETVTC